MWGGGNELTWGGHTTKEGIKPLDYSHPCIAAMRDVVLREDPQTRFVATSPAGPRFSVDPAAPEFGQGLHHDVHGPWGLGSFKDLDAWRAHWAAQDALLHSEVGMPGAASLEHIRRYAGEALSWPPQGPYWMHVAAWWTQWDRYASTLEDLPPDDGLAKYVELTQTVQAEAYAVAAQSAKGRFPQCGGFIIWMGHDCFPCPANNSVIDFDRQPKPAYFALKDVFTA